MNDFEETYKKLIIHGVSLPSERIRICIPGAKEILENCLKYILSFQSKNLSWLPEYNNVASWLEDNKGRGLLLYGDCGRGKSLISRYALPMILLKYTNYVINTYDVQEMNKSIDDIISKKTISLDDIGTEELSVSYGNKRLAFAEIMDAVEKYGKLIIISTNLSGPELKARYGERVMERVISTTKRVEFKGKSLRE